MVSIAFSFSVILLHFSWHSSKVDFGFSKSPRPLFSTARPAYGLRSAAPPFCCVRQAFFFIPAHRLFSFQRIADRLPMRAPMRARRSCCFRPPCSTGSPTGLQHSSSHSGIIFRHFSGRRPAEGPLRLSADSEDEHSFPGFSRSRHAARQNLFEAPLHEDA